MASELADADAADAASAESASSCRPGNQGDRSPPLGCPSHIQEPSPSSSTPGPSPDRSSPQRRTPFPISFPLIFQRSKVPSASLAASTAEGKPVPVTDPTDAHPTSALQKLNSKYPSAIRRHGYTPEASSAQSSTYSQPVLVRTYSGPSPSQGSRSSRSRQYRPPSSSRGVSRRVPLPSASTPGSSVPGQPIQPTVSGVGVGTTSRIDATNRPILDTADTSAYGVNMPRPYKPKNATTGSSKLPLPWPFQSSRQGPEEPKLPPLEAFSFKSFMADLQSPGGDNDISADLDRIAEICARSRYSLSNQYEVHVAPHGSGASFMSGAGALPSSAPRRKGHSRSRSHGHGSGGPTLQAITSDDETASARSHPRRRNGNRQRRSAAYGTLETIMSSSRSSEEDKSKKKSAAELAGEVRGRAARKAWDNNPSTSASGSASASAGNSNTASSSSAGAQTDTNATNPDDGANARLARKKSASFATAILDTNSSRSSKGKALSSSTAASPSRHSHRQHKTAAGSSSSGLLSEPARPQTSGSHLGVRTTPAVRGGDGDSTGKSTAAGTRTAAGGGSGDAEAGAGAGELPHQGIVTRRTSDGGTGSSSWGGWIPWGGGGTAQGQGQGQGGGNGNGGKRVSHAEGSLRSLLKGAGGGEGQVGRGLGR